MTSLVGNRTRFAAVALVGAGLVTSLSACNDKKGTATPRAAVTLPAGSLSAYVPQPQEVPAGLVPLLNASGPADIAKLSSFSGNASSARTSLAKHGFTDGYIVEYANTTAGQSITVVVSRFATASGATEDLSGDLSGKLPTGASALVVPQIGDQSGAVTQPLPNGSAGSTLVTVRFRVGAMTWLVAVGANGSVDPSSVTGIASSLAARAANPSASPAA